MQRFREGDAIGVASNGLCAAKAFGLAVDGHLGLRITCGDRDHAASLNTWQIDDKDLARRIARRRGCPRCIHDVHFLGGDGMDLPCCV